MFLQHFVRHVLGSISCRHLRVLFSLVNLLLRLDLNSHHERRPHKEIPIQIGFARCVYGAGQLCCELFYRFFVVFIFDRLYSHTPTHSTATGTHHRAPFLSSTTVVCAWHLHLARAHYFCSVQSFDVLARCSTTRHQRPLRHADCVNPDHSRKASLLPESHTVLSRSESPFFFDFFFCKLYSHPSRCVVVSESFPLRE